jgi:hypothetical protein
MNKMMPKSPEPTADGAGWAAVPVPGTGWRGLGFQRLGVLRIINIYRLLPKPLLLGAGLILLSGCAIWNGGLPASYSTKDKYPIVSSVHGIRQYSVSADQHGIVKSYSSTNEITLNTNTTQGWQIQIKPAEKKLAGREFYILPKPARWPTNYGVVSPDKTTCISDFIIPKGIRYISRDWGMFPDDPLGEYRIVIFIDRKLAADFTFRVIEGTNAAGALKH